MPKKRLVACSVAALLCLAFSAPAQAAPGACFDWICDTNTGACDFDASCSGDTPLDYRWTWGDGSPRVNFWNNPYATHTYASPIAGAYVTLSVGYLLIGYYDITCWIQIRNVIGPPQPYLYGTCS